MGNKRKEARPKRLVKGIPGGDCDSCSAWLLQNIGKTKDAGSKVGDIARDQFTILLDDCVRTLLELALPERAKNTIAKGWAGTLLARLHASLEAHQWKLGRENPAYRDWKAKLEKTRANVLVPESELSQMVQDELRTAEAYQSILWFLRKSIEDQPELHLLSINTRAVIERVRDQLVLQHFVGVSRTQLTGEALEWRYGALWTEQGRAAIEKAARKATPGVIYPDEITQRISCTWQDLAQRKGIPKMYWATVDFGRFCAESADKWWNWLWAYILKDKEVLLPNLDPSKDKKQIRDYFRALVEAREDGTF